MYCRAIQWTGRAWEVWNNGKKKWDKLTTFPICRDEAKKWAAQDFYTCDVDKVHVM